VIEAMLPYLTTHFGNPSSSHHYAQQPRRALAAARQQVARLIGAAPDELVFTGSGSEADTLAIHGTIAAHRRPSGVQVITQVTEHPAVLEACRALHRRYGTEVTYLPVSHDGRGALNAPARLARRSRGPSRACGRVGRGRSSAPGSAGTPMRSASDAASSSA